MHHAQHLLTLFYKPYKCQVRRQLGVSSSTFVDYAVLLLVFFGYVVDAAYNVHILLLLLEGAVLL
jgi:hypothetical protein